MPATLTPKIGFSYNYGLGENGWKSGYDENWVRADSLIISTYGYNRLTSVGLVYGYLGGYASVNGALAAVVSGTILLTNNATNYVERDVAGVVTSNVIAFTSGRVPLAIAVTLGGTITNVTDARSIDSSLSTITQNYLPVFNLANYGAVVGGDISAAMAAAKIAAVAAGGGIIEVPNNNYTSPNGFSFTTSNIIVRGSGEHSQITYAAGGGSGFAFTGGTNVGVEKLKIAGLLSIGVLFSACTRFFVRRNNITGCTSNLHATSYAGGVHAWVCDDGEISDNYFSGNGYISNSPASSDIQTNGNGANVGSLRIRIKNNKCLSVNSQSCIAAYDVQKSQITGNIVTGGKTGTGNNNGYGIMIYRSVGNSGLCENNDVSGNHCHDCEGTGIYIQSSRRTRVRGNTIDRCGTVQDDTTLPVGAIAFNGAPESTCEGNGGVDNGRSSITLADVGVSEGYAIGINTFSTTVANVKHIYIRCPIKRSSFVGGSYKGGTNGIATAPVDLGITDSVFSGMTFDTQSARCIDIYGIARSVFHAISIKNSGGNGLSLVGNAGNIPGCARNTIAFCQIWDGGTVADNAYAGIDLSLAQDTLVIGNQGGNTGVTGYKYFILMIANNTNSIVRFNKGFGGRTANYNVDATAAAAIAFDGNFDSADARPQDFDVRQQMIIKGSATSVTQLLLGSSSSSGCVGTGFSGGDTFIGQNAKSSLGVDNWHQNNAAAASRLFTLRANGDAEFLAVNLGTADNNFTTFWGTPKVALMATGGVKVNGNQVLTGRQGAVATPNAQTAAYVQADVTSLKTAIDAIRTVLTTHGLTA